MKKGDSVNYFGRPAVVVEFDRSHVLIQFENGVKLCTNIHVFDSDKKEEVRKLQKAKQLDLYGNP